MNYEIIKTTLLDIIKEAKNLPESELEIVPGSKVFVKKGRAKEFDVNAYYYFEHEHNVFITDNMDYVTDVYQMLEQEVLDDNNDYYQSQAYDIFNVNREDITRLDALNKSLETIKSNYEKLSSASISLQNKLSETDYTLWKEKFDKINTDINELAYNKNIIEHEILNIKKKVNENFIKTIHEQMALIESNFRNTRNGTNVSYAINGESILTSDLEEYNSLIGLLKIISSVNEQDKIISYQGVICINENQLSDVEVLFNKTNLFQKLNKPKVEVVPKKPNEELIASIVEELRNIEDKTKKEKKKTVSASNDKKIGAFYIQEYENLLKVLKILHKADDSKWELTSMWGMAYILGEDRSEFEKLARDTEFFNPYNPDTKKVTDNEKVILELKEYLRTLEQKMNHYHGVSNIPSRQTNDGTIVLKEDLNEYNTILEILSLLENDRTHLVNVWNIGNVSFENISKFKNLVNRTRYFGDKTPKIEANEIELKNIKMEIAKLFQKAKETGKDTIEINGLILESSDLDKYKLLVQKYSYLEAAKESEDLVSVGSVKVDENHVSKYLEVVKKLENLEQNIEAPIIGEEAPLTEEEPVIQNSTQLGSDTKELEIDRGPTGLMPYVAPVESLTPYQTKKEEEPVSAPTLTSNSKDEVKPRKKVVSVRKLANDSLRYIKENWKKIVAIGLCLGIASLTLTELAPIIIYANSCNALALPGLAGFFNSLSSLVASFSNIHFLNGAWITSTGTIINLGAASSKSLAATIIALSGLGIVGGSFAIASKILKSEHTDKLPNPKEQHSVIDKLKKLARNLKRIEERTTNLEQNISANEDDLFQEIEKNVEHKIEVEAEEATKKRIEERAAHLEQEVPSVAPSVEFHNSNMTDEAQQEVKMENKPVIEIPSDEEILETITDKKLVLAQTDQYIENKKSGINSKKYRDLVLETTGIDLNDYDINEQEGIVEARSDVAHSMNLSKSDLIEQISNKIRVLQNMIDEGLLPSLELDQARVDIDVLNNRIASLQKNERGK